MSCSAESDSCHSGTILRSATASRSSLRAMPLDDEESSECTESNGDEDMSDNDVEMVEVEEWRRKRR